MSLKIMIEKEQKSCHQNQTHARAASYKCPVPLHSFLPIKSLNEVIIFAVHGFLFESYFCSDYWPKFFLL